MRNHRYIAIAAIALVSAAASVFASGTTEAPQSDGPVTISYMFSDADIYPYTSDWWALERIAEIGNVTFDMQPVPGSDYATKRQLIFASGDIPDVVQAGIQEAQTYAPQGLVLPLSDHQDLTPNFLQLVDLWDMEDDVEQLILSDGKYYVFPEASEVGVQKVGWIYRQDLLEKFGMEVPADLQEFRTFLERAREDNPDSLGYTSTAGLARVLAHFGLAYGLQVGQANPAGYELADDGTWYHAPSTERYREMLAYVRDLMADGLIDPEIFTQTGQQLNAKVYSGRIAVVTHAYAGGTRYTTNGRQQVGEAFTMQSDLPPAGPYGQDILYLPRFAGGSVINAALSSEPRFERVLTFLDWMYYSDEAARILTWGEEGVTHTVEGGSITWPSQFADADGIPVRAQLTAAFGIDHYAFAMRHELDFLLMDFDPNGIGYFNTLVENGWIADPPPVVRFNDFEVEELGIIGTPIEDYVEEMSIKFIIGAEDLDADWDDYLTRLERLGVDEVIEIYQTAWAR